MSHQQYKKKREQYAVQLRRKHREQTFSKKRNMGSTTQNSSESNLPNDNNKKHIIDLRFQKQITQFHTSDLTKQNPIELFKAIHDPDPIKKHYGAIGIRQLLCLKHDPPVQIIIDAGIVPNLMQFAIQTQYPQLQLQATWCIANIAAGTNSQCNSVIEKGAISVLIKQLESEHIGIVQQAIWALGNIACDIPAHRNSILKNGGLKNLVKVIQISQPLLQKNPALIEIIQSASWTLSNLARSQPHVQYAYIKEALPVFFSVLKNNLIKQVDIIANICWAISYYTNKKPQKKPVDKIQKCIDSGVMSRFIEYIQRQNDSLIVACLRIMGTVASGTQSQTKYVISLGILDYMQPLILRKKKKTIRRQACWLISNITASSQQCISAFATNNALVGYLLKILQQDLPDVKTEVCFVLTNIVEFGQPKDIYVFFKNIDIMKYYIEMIQKQQDTALLQVVYETLYYIIKVGEKFKQFETDINKTNYFVYRLYEGKVIEKMQSMQYHDDEKIYMAVGNIFQSFFTLLDPLQDG